MVTKYFAGKATTADAREATKGRGSRKRTPSTSTKKWKEAGITISVTIPNKASMADVAQALIDRGNRILEDGRVGSAA